MNIKARLLWIFGLLLLACPHDPQPTIAPPPDPPPPPPSPRVSLLDLIPPTASGAVLVNMAEARTVEHGAGIIEALRRLAETAAWERITEIDPNQDVQRLLLFAQVDPDTEDQSNLTNILQRLSAESRGFVFELLPTVEGAGDECREEDLAQAQPERVEGPNPDSFVWRCGRFVIVSCCVPEPQALRRNRSAAANALSDLPQVTEGAIRIAAIVAGPGAMNRVSCEESTISLAGWHSATAELGQGLRIDAVIHTSTAEEAPILQNCLRDNVEEIANLPLVQQLGVTDMINAVQIELDEGDTMDVHVSIPLSARQTEVLMNLLGMFGGI